MPLDITVTENTIAAKINLITPAVMNAAVREISLVTIMLVGHIKSVTLPKSGLERRTGALSRSIVPGKVERGAASVTGRVLAGQGLPYARIHEYGGEIKPVHGQFLAIPLDAVKTQAGVARFGPRQAESQGWKTFFAGGAIMGKQPGDAEATPLFALKRSVTMPARPYFAPGIRDKKTEVQNALARALGAAIEKL